MGELLNQELITGLSSKKASELLATSGYNELPSEKHQNVFSVLVKVLSEPMLLLLLGISGLYLILGEMRDALMLLVGVFVLIGINFYQERKTGKTLEALRNLSSPRALVIRDGEQTRIPGREVVKEDIIILHEGDRVPADAVILFCENLSIDESLLTGESVPVKKSEWDGKLEKQKPSGDNLPFAYSGSLVISGRGIAKVIATGRETEMGKIGKSLEGIKDEETLLNKETSKVVKYMGIIAIILCLFVVIAYTIIKGNLIQGFLAGLTLSMSLMPEEFPVVLIIFLTIGAWRISKKKVLTRHPASIETLGAATILCADKTGTLTLNKLELVSLYNGTSSYEITNGSKSFPHEFTSLLEYSILASEKNPFDPIEKELRRVENLYLNKKLKMPVGWELIKEYPLSKELFVLSHVWQSPDKKFLIASKGAPETIINLCRVKKDEKENLLHKISQMSDKGLRVLGVAQATISEAYLPKDQRDFPFKFAGLLGFVDPARPSAAEAVKEAYGAGIRVIMITGDYPGTAQYIAKEIGIKNPELFITGDELEKISISELREKIRSVNIFARVIPEQKLLIVDALKANGEIVAMTGDGVNDAPALKSANIGIAMGERGTDVAREASSLVLLNDDFSSIVAAVRLGRRIFDNIKRAMGYVLAVHVPIAGMAILPVILNLPIVLLPAHIAFLELIIDPACSTVFEAEKEDENIMERPPRNLSQPIFSKRTVLLSMLQGFGILSAVFLVFIFAVITGRGELEVRSFAFTALVLANLLLIVVNLSWRKTFFETFFSASKTFYIVIGGALVSLFAVLYIPFLSNLFHLAPLRLDDFIYIVSAAVLSLLWFELVKLFVIRPASAKLLRR